MHYYAQLSYSDSVNRWYPPYFTYALLPVLGRYKCTSDTPRAEIKSEKVWHYRGSQIEI